MSACDLEIFSHRGLSGDAKVDRPLLTESALLGLATRGIRNFDLDLSFSTDGMLLVAHPAAVQQELGKSVDVFSHAFSDLRAMHPALLTASRLLDLVERNNLTVALDLKGSDVRPTAHAAHLLKLATRVVESESLQRRVWLWADSSAISRTLHRDLRKAFNLSDLGHGIRRLQQRRHTLTVIKAIRDRGVSNAKEGGDIDCSESQLAVADLRLFTMLGPSLRCANTKLLAAPWARARWGVSGSWSRGGAHREGSTSKHPLIVAASATVAAVAPLFSFLGHSAPVRTLPGFLDSTRQGAGLLVWVVDDAAELSTLLKLGVRRVISNTPLELKRAVQRMCDNVPGRG